MKKSKKSIIDIYPTIYDVDIVVANKYTTMKQINKLCKSVEGKDIEDDGKSIAWTDIGYDRKTNKAIIIVKHNHDSRVVGVNKKTDLINTCAHEALHVCMDIFCKIEEDVHKNNSNEQFAYLLGYVTECIYKTFTK